MYRNIKFFESPEELQKHLFGAPEGNDNAAKDHTSEGGSSGGGSGGGKSSSSSTIKTDGGSYVPQSAADNVYNTYFKDKNFDELSGAGGKVMQYQLEKDKPWVSSPIPVTPEQQEIYNNWDKAKVESDAFKKEFDTLNPKPVKDATGKYNPKEVHAYNLKIGQLKRSGQLTKGLSNYEYPQDRAKNLYIDTFNQGLNKRGRELRNQGQGLKTI